MKKCLVTILSLLTIIIAGCAAPSSSEPAADSDSLPTPSVSLSASLADKANFRFLVSDEKNAIDDFKNLYVTVSKVGVQQGGDSDNWTQFTPAITRFDLKTLIGENATPLWSGNITPGRYEKAFIYVSDVSGILASSTDNQSTNVKLPGGKLQISKPFTISDNMTTSFVFDITVIKTGNGKYILKPQVEASGADQKFKEVKSEEEREEKREKNGPETEDEDELRLRVEGKHEPGAEVTLLVSDGKSPVAGAIVSMNDKTAGTTDSDGKLKITLPSTTGEVEISAVSGSVTGEVEIELRANGKPEKPGK